MKRVQFLVVVILAAAALAVGCSHKMVEPYNIPWDSSGLTSGTVGAPEGETSEGELPEGTETVPPVVPEEAACPDMDGDGVCDADDPDIDGDGIMNADDDFDTKKSVFVPTEISYEMSSPEAVAAMTTLNFMDTEDDSFDPRLYILVPQSDPLKKVSISLDMVAPAKLDPEGKTAVLKMNVSRSTTNYMKICTGITPDTCSLMVSGPMVYEKLPDLTLDMEFERDPTDGKITKVKADYEGPDFINNKPLDLISQKIEMAYSDDGTGNLLTELTLGGVKFLTINDTPYGLLTSQRRIKVGSSFTISMNVERDPESGRATKGMYALSSIDFPMKFTSSSKDVSGKMVLTVDGQGSYKNETVTPPVEYITKTRIMSRQSDDLALANMRKVLTDAIVFSTIDMYLWLPLP